jgi:hypothetical protein
LGGGGGSIKFFQLELFEKNLFRKTSATFSVSLSFPSPGTANHCKDCKIILDFAAAAGGCIENLHLSKLMDCNFTASWVYVANKR